ncbi:MAG: MotA/TolQ/ExbB proton channel family protein [Methylacidiphilales bacterium]|nr:MotA/TolQ/ExbB proton channel family protein [Candidatus Methylacidiphilales bacterium]
MRTYSFRQESPDKGHFLPAVLTSFLLFAPLVGAGLTAISIMLVFQRISALGEVNISALAGPMATALAWTAMGTILWLIGLGSFLFLTLKLDYKRVWFWRMAVASCILLIFSSSFVAALPALCFLWFLFSRQSRLLPGQPD